MLQCDEYFVTFCRSKHNTKCHSHKRQGEIKGYGIINSYLTTISNVVTLQLIYILKIKLFCTQQFSKNDLPNRWQFLSWQNLLLRLKFNEREGRGSLILLHHWYTITQSVCKNKGTEIKMKLKMHHNFFCH